MKIIYKTKAISTGGRDDGKVRIENSPYEFDLVLPSKLGNSGKTGINPEQLFAAGYSACFESALRGIARLNKIELMSASVEVEISMGKNDDGAYALAADITAILGGIDQTQANTLVQQAHQKCPYSIATRGNIEVSLSARVS